jgi:hypothetical protein
MTPYASVDLTEIIEEVDGKYLVYRSPDSAEESADYELIAECDARESADRLLQSDRDDSEKGNGSVGFV